MYGLSLTCEERGILQLLLLKASQYTSPLGHRVPSYCHIPEYCCAGLDPEQWMALSLADMKSGSYCHTCTLFVNFDSFWALKLAL